MPAGMAFGLLGPLTVHVDGVEAPIPPGKQRVILAALLLDAGRTVAAEELTELLWGSEPPPSAAVTLQNHVKRLRRALGVGRDRIVTQPGGYLIQVNPGELDVAAMESALASAHQAAQASAWADAAAPASAALAFWRGQPLSGVDSDMLASREIQRLAELRFQARELRIEAGLQLGGHAMVVSDARQLSAEEPLREHSHALLIRALQGCGRRAEALAAYQDARRTLIDELGCEPGPELRALHHEILEEATDPPPAPAPNGRTVPVPRQLPAAVATFTGRSGELTALTSLLGSKSNAQRPALVISAIGGTAGVGKTALAVYWAHQVAELFPDGQLYVNLRGYDPYEPVAPGAALAGFLQALGVPGPQIPDEVEDRARLYRSRLAGLRVLVVLDNARDAEQVRPLLPGDPRCVAAITSRDVLAGLVAVDGARRLNLDVLPLADAVARRRPGWRSCAPGCRWRCGSRPSWPPPGHGLR
jgi:DNA-binding SARP family transcriptional activator